MLIYEVNIQADPEIANDYEQWLLPHIREILEIDGFIRADLTEVLPDDHDAPPGKKYWSVSVYYYIEDKASLERYYENHAPRLRREGIQKFGNRFTASRRVLEIKQSFR